MSSQKRLWNLAMPFCSIAPVLFLTAISAPAQEQKPKAPPVPGPMLSQGMIDIHTADFDLTLVRSSQTVAALKPNVAPDFDFTPGDLLVERSQNGYFHLGDITLRLRTGASDEWSNYSTASQRMPVKPLPTSQSILAASDLAATLPESIPLRITREWATEQGHLVLRFTLKNKTDKPIEIGALGIPMIFNNVLNDRSLDDAHAKCSFYDPYIGEDAGYLQVTRLSGQGPALLVVPDNRTPFEAYNPILDKPNHFGARPVFTDPTPRGITFEGFYEWMVHSQAYAGNEWKGVQEWNPPTSLTLKPGESKTYGVKFLLAPSIRAIEQTLTQNRRPVAVGVPGYVLPTDIDARLFLQYSKPVESIAVEPRGAVAISRAPSASKEWASYNVRGKQWGRSRLTITYADGTIQTIHYFVTKPEAEVVADMGRFLTTKQWFVDSNDPFHRGPSAMTYDREANAIVMQDSRAWIAGLGDEGGGGAWLSAMMKEWVEPDKEEIAKLEQFVDEVLWGRLQYEDGPHPYGVRKSLFYYQPEEMPPNSYRSDFDWSTWTSWNKKASEQVDRSYDYPHVAAAYWVFYHLARNTHGVDLKREGMKEQADNLEEKMRARADRWRSQAYPFGSEMPWDSTGQEEVYAWTKYFGYNDKAGITLNAILGYDPTIPHWGYNGSARRYWDFIFAAKDRRLERQLHHYGSGLNAIPLLAEYREHPDDFYLLRVGYGGAMGALTDIDQEGFASAAFHSFPDMLTPDPLSGDYGPNFFGHAWNTASYLVHHPHLGWLAFGGNVEELGGMIKVTPLDSARTRVYIAPFGLWLTLDAGRFQSVELNPGTGTVRLILAAATQFSAEAQLHIEEPAHLKHRGNYHPVKTYKFDREAYVVPLTEAATPVELTNTQ